MNPPRPLQLLRHGRFLCRAAFSRFVETWNWLVTYVDNLKGDADLNPLEGHVTVDRTRPDAPVVRLVNLDLLQRGGSEDGGDGGIDEETAREIAEEVAGESVSALDGLTVVTGIGYNTSTGYITVTTRQISVVNGKLTLGQAVPQNAIETIPFTEHYPNPS